MATVTKKAFAPVQLTASAATYYLCPVNVRATIKKLSASNNDAVTRTVTAYLVPSGGTAGVTNIATITLSLGPNETKPLFNIEGHCIEPGDFLQMKADSAGQVTVHGTVVETGV